MTIEEIAKEMGIDASAFDPRFIGKVNEHFAAADTQFKSANELKSASEANLRKVQEEQDAINAQIAAFGKSEETTLALQANYAAMEAQLKTLKEQGINVNIPAAITNPNPNPASPAFDANKFRNDTNLAVMRALDVTNEYQRIFGKPMPDSIEKLASEASALRKPFNREFVAEKYGFTAEQTRQQEAAQAKRDADIAAKAVKEYQERNPTPTPFTRPGVESQYSKVIKPRDAKDQRAFANQPERTRIAQSVARTRQAIAANQS